MQEVFDKLRALQDTLSRKIVLEREIVDAPKMFSAQDEAINRLKKTYIEKNKDFEQTKAAETEFRNLLFEAESARENAEKRMDLINTQREYEALEKEIRDAAEREQQYRKDLLQKSHIIEELDEEISRSEAFIEQQQAELAASKAENDKKLSGKSKELENLIVEEKKITSGLDDELIFKFDRIIRNKLGIGIVPVKGSVCTGCHMILPAEFANKVREGLEVVYCPYCSRILYYDPLLDEMDEIFDNDTAGSLADLDDDDEEDEDEAEEEGVETEYDN
jgi:predicted  nucleic acid-binding Zn-ribbon protein